MAGSGPRNAGLRKVAPANSRPDEESEAAGAKTPAAVDAFVAEDSDDPLAASAAEDYATEADGEATGRVLVHATRGRPQLATQRRPPTRRRGNRSESSGDNQAPAIETTFTVAANPEPQDETPSEAEEEVEVEVEAAAVELRIQTPGDALSLTVGADATVGSVR